jgi:hypothetical protein
MIESIVSPSLQIISPFLKSNCDLQEFSFLRPASCNASKNKDLKLQTEQSEEITCVLIPKFLSVQKYSKI